MKGSRVKHKCRYSVLHGELDERLKQLIRLIVKLEDRILVLESKLSSAGIK